MARPHQEQLASVHVHPQFSNVPSIPTVRVSVLESISGHPAKEVFLGDPMPRLAAEAVDASTDVRLLILPAEAEQKWMFQLENGENRQVIGRVTLSQAQLIKGMGKAWKLSPPDSADAAPSEAGKDEFGVYLDLEAGAGSRISAKEGIKHVSHHTEVTWTEWPHFDHLHAREEHLRVAQDYAAKAEFVEVEVSAKGLVSFDALTKANPLVSAHVSGGDYTLLDHTEVQPEVHEPQFRQRLVVQTVHQGRVLPIDVLFRVYDVAGEGLHRRVEGPQSLLGQTPPVSLASLAQVRSSKQPLTVSLGLASNAELDKRLRKKGASITVMSVRAFGEKLGRQLSRQASRKGGVDGGEEKPEIVIVDAQGKPHVASAQNSGETVSLTVGALNLPKLRPMAEAVSPLVALWESPDGKSDWKLVATTEQLSLQADPHFAQALKFSLAPASPSAAPDVKQYRLDVYDVSEDRVNLSSDRVGYAYLSREELSALGGAEDHSERNITLQSDQNSMQKKLTARSTSVQLSRADAPEETKRFRLLTRQKTIDDKVQAVAAQKAAFLASRRASGGPIETPTGSPKAAASVEKSEEVSKEESNGEKKEPSGLQPVGPAASAAAADSHLRAPVPEAGPHSRRASIDTTEMDDALLAERVALARVEACQKALDAFLAANKKGKKFKQEKAQLEADLEQAKAEAAAATLRATAAREALALKRQQRREEEEAAAAAAAARAADPLMTQWGMRNKRSGSLTHQGSVMGGHSRGLSDVEAAQSADIKTLIAQKRAAAGAAQAAALQALLTDRRSPAAATAPLNKSIFLSLRCSVKNIKNTGAWMPCVAVYESAAASDRVPGGAWVYLDHTEKISDRSMAELGTGSFSKPLLVEYFPSADGTANQQQLRLNLFNAGAKDAVVEEDLIASANIGLADLVALLGSDADSHRSVEVYLYCSGKLNQQLSHRMKRQGACIVLSLAQSIPSDAEGVGSKPSSGHALVVGAAPVPLTLEGGADPDPAEKPFALSDTSASSAPAPVIASSSDIKDVAAATAHGNA